MKRLIMAFSLLILVTSTSAYSSGLTDPVVESQVASDKDNGDGSGFKKFIFLLLLLGVGI